MEEALVQPHNPGYGRIRRGVVSDHGSMNYHAGMMIIHVGME
jgi:hypothetical protein